MSEDHVKPGDLITATLWNDVVDRLDRVEARVSALESGSGVGAVRIDSLTPAGDLQVGQRVTVSGVNFGISHNTTSVLINNEYIPDNNIDRSNSTDTTLYFTIPGISGIPTGGASYSIVVSNGKTSASITRFIVPPPQVPQGSVYVYYLDTNPTAATPGLVSSNAQTLVRFRVVSDATIPATFQFGARILNQMWNTAILGDTSKLLQPGETTVLTVATNVPSVANNTYFLVAASATAGPLVYGSSTLVGSKVGSVTPPADSSIQIAYDTLELTGTMQATYDGAVLTCQKSSVGASNAVIMTFLVKFSTTGTYPPPIVNVEEAGTDWEASSYSVEWSGPITNTSKSYFLQILVQPTVSTAKPLTYVKVTVQKSGSAGAAVYLFAVSLV